MNLYATLDRLGFRELLRSVYRIEVVGGEHVPADGGVILAANHESVIDPFILGVATTRPIRYMAKAELWRNRLVAATLDAFGTFPVERGGGDRAAIEQAGGLLAAGEVIAVFPQGTSKQLPNRRYHRGAARLALATGAPLVPVRLENTRRLPGPSGRTRILVGPAIRVPAARPTVAHARDLTARLEREILELAA